MLAVLLPFARPFPLLSCLALLLASCAYTPPHVEGEGDGDGDDSTGTGASMLDSCGDGQLDLPAEKCDDGNLRPGDGCGPDCQIENHDGCDGAILPLGKGGVVFQGTTIGATDDIMSSATVQNCGEGNRYGPDLIYAVEPIVNGYLSVALSAQYANHLLHVRTACPGTNVDEIGCDHGYEVSKQDVFERNVQAGELLYIIVDGHENDGGKFVLTIGLY
jgi:cysteine-rich repeat protein